MAKATRIDNAAAKAACDAVVDQLDLGAAPKFRIYGGTRPASPDAAITAGASLLAEIDLNSVTAAFGSAIDGTPGGVATADGVPTRSDTNATGHATRDASFFRATTGTATGGVISGTIGVTANFDAVIDNVDIDAGQTVKLTSWTVTMPES